ncbi:class I SAM-dependent methyltransferase [Listeria aquatica]|uniref:class I SAM-dependent methyltransferase n=1 Tax=Listeria aquatica TaxID=1494960 RepID=UPI003EF2FD36
MSENIYDNPDFFNSYSQMERSKKGLEAAGEWHTLKEMLPDFTGKRVLDLGCGYGWHSVYAAEQGATSVTGVDISEKMLQVARAQTNLEAVEYLHEDIEKVRFEKDSFDIVISSLVFHYVEKFDELVKKVHHFLKANGTFIFSIEHPVFTAEGSQDFIYDEDGNIISFPVDHYFDSGKRTVHFLGQDMTKYHRTITQYFESLRQNGFRVDQLKEPTPGEEMQDIPGMRDEFRRPMMLIFSATNIK